MAIAAISDWHKPETAGVLIVYGDASRRDRRLSPRDPQSISAKIMAPEMMKQIVVPHSALYALSADDLARLTLAVALGLLHAPVALHPKGWSGALVRFRSLEEARRIEAHIA